MVSIDKKSHFKPAPAKVTPLNGAGLSTDLLSEEEKHIQQKKAEIEEQEAALKLKKQQAEEAEKARKLDEYNALRDDAAGFRRSASVEPDEANKRMYLQWAIDADRQAAILARELGLAVEETDDNTKPLSKGWQSLMKHRLAGVLQLALLCLVIWWSYSLFLGYGEYIRELNQKLPDSQQMAPYDPTSIQKFFYEKYVEMWDMPFALLKVLIVVPFVAFYAIPGLRSRKDFFTEFFEDLTPFQRCVITFCFIALFLLHSALSHGVKP